MKKPTQPTREQLQETINDLLKLNAERKSSCDAMYKITDRLEKENLDLAGKLAAADGRYMRLTATSSSRFHWIETVVAIVVISTFTFTIGLNVGRHKTTKPVVWLSIPSVDSLTYSNMNSAFDNATKTNRVISTNQITDTGRTMWITNLISNFNFYNAHPIITRKGAELLRP